MTDALAALWAARSGGGTAWTLWRHGVCLGCAVGHGGPHLCPPGLEALQEEAAEALVPADLLDIRRLRRLGGARGRLAHCYRYRRGDRGFVKVTWDEALNRIQRAEVCSTGRCAETLALAPRPSSALADVLGTSESTCALEDLARTDLIIVWRTDLRRHPRLRRIIRHARKQGAVVAIVGPDSPVGPLHDAWLVLERGDMALADALVGAVDRDDETLGRFTTGIQRVLDRQQGLEAVTTETGVATGRIRWLIRRLQESRSVVTVVTEDVVSDALRAVANLHLATGHVSRPGSGILVLPRVEPDTVTFRADGLRAHLAPSLTTEMLEEEDEVWLLPASTPHEREGGALLETCGSWRVHAPHLLNPPGQARAPWRVLAEVQGVDIEDIAAFRRFHGLRPGSVAPACRDAAYALPDGLARFA